MERNSPSQRSAQLDTAEREHLEDVVTGMRERVEDNVRFQLTQRGLDDKPGNINALDEGVQQLVEAIELEASDGESWVEAFERYVTGVGYTIINRLAALRCMEVREFVDEEVTVFKDNGLTPAAETLVHEEFLLEDEAIIEAYHNACDDRAEEIEILFDRSSAYSLIDPDEDTFEELCGLLDTVPDEVWRADDVLGWVYEYYNQSNLDEIRARAHSGGGLRTRDVSVANQFYTPHWVVRMLTDNALGKLYLEHTGELSDVINEQRALSPDERTNRPLSPAESSSVAEFCTYLIPSEKEGSPSEFDHPEELRVIDPACGSGHFLLYAFDVLERIWRAETDIDPAEIPHRILENNLYGVDLDMRACQLAAFSLYLKGRGRAEAEGAESFGMPDIGIVCADASVADVEGIEEVFDEVAAGNPAIEDALTEILDAFENVDGLGSLLDVRGTLGDRFEDDVSAGGKQLTLADDPHEDHTLGQVLHSLRETIDNQRDDDSFLAQDLKSFVRLIDVLVQEYDVALMNPPYGSGKRMPPSIQEYVDEQYDYYKEFYINFFEVCERLTCDKGRIGMLVPWTLLFKRSFQEFREDFLGPHGSFDFLAEYGYGVLDNATVGTIGTVVRTGDVSNQQGEFIRLHDVDKGDKEEVYATVIAEQESDVNRYYSVDLREFSAVPGTPMMYSIPSSVRDLHDTELKIDPERANIDGKKIGDAVQGLGTSNNDRFVRLHWECGTGEFKPYAKGGTKAWVLPQQITAINWDHNGKEIDRLPTSRFQNTDYYMKDGLTWSYIKRTGRRFGYVPETIFDVTGSMLFPKEEYSPWSVMCVLNSTVYHGLFLSLTPERDWQIEVVGRIPWHERLSSVDELEEIAKEQYTALAWEKSQDPRHPLYMGPGLLPDPDTRFYPNNGHLARDDSIAVDRSGMDQEWTIKQSARVVERRHRETRKKLEWYSEKADSIIAETLDLSTEILEQLRSEIFLRTAESVEDREVPDPESVPETPDNLLEQVHDLVHHFAMEVVRDKDDGIVPISASEQPTMADRIIERFHDVYGEYAEVRLAEVDDVLGSQSADQEAYPNLREFVANKLFEYHVSRMEKTPIVWQLSSKRLVSDSDEEAFGCFIDYHSLDTAVLDRLTNQYLEPRKAELRKRRTAAERRRSDDSLPTSEQAAANEEYERSTNGLQQIEAFEETIQKLATNTPRRFGDANRRRAAELKTAVTQFRQDTETRLEALDRLHGLKGDNWFADTFSPTFWKSVQEERNEWIDALEELEVACEAYTAASDEPVEAYLADLFDYFSRLKGTEHYSSNGILFTTYYFEREAEPFLNPDGEPKEGLKDEHATLLATLGANLEEYKELAKEIEADCETLGKAIPSDWADRALSEITTAGYQPNRKYGVDINITPLADAEIVPKTVDDQVL